MSFTKGQPLVSFQETVASARLTTVYTLEVRDQQTQAVVAEQRLENTEAKAIEIPVAGLAREGKYDVLLHVERHGINVAQGSLSFDQKISYEKKELDPQEIAQLRDKSQVQLIAIEGAGADRLMVVQDATADLEEVKSTYKLVVWKKLSNGKIDWLGEKSFSRQEITRAGGDLTISFKAIGVNPVAGQKLYFDLVVNRTSDQYLSGQKVQFIVSKTF